MANGDDKKRGDSGGERARATDPSDVPSAMPSRGTILARARPKIAAFVETLDRATELLALMEPREAVKELQAEGVSRRSAYRYVGLALKRLQADASIEPIESKRARHRAVLVRRMRKAESHKRTYETNGETVEVEAPDYKAANAAHAMIMQLDGVLPGKVGS